MGSGSSRQTPTLQKMECVHPGAQGQLFRKERKTATHPDGRCPDPGGHPHGWSCAPRGWRQDARAAGEERNVKEAVSPPLPPSRRGEPPRPPRREGRGPQHLRRHLPSRSPGAPRLPRSSFPIHARSGQNTVPSLGRRERGHNSLYRPSALKLKGLGASGSTNPSAGSRGTGGDWLPLPPGSAVTSALAFLRCGCFGHGSRGRRGRPPSAPVTATRNGHTPGNRILSAWPSQWRPLGTHRKRVDATPGRSELQLPEAPAGVPPARGGAGALRGPPAGGALREEGRVLCVRTVGARAGGFQYRRELQSWTATAHRREWYQLR